MSEERNLKNLITEAINKPGMQLPVFNPVALELQQLMSNDNASMQTMESTIMRDPALVMQVLRMANSAVYSGLAEIGTLKQALMRVGSQQVLRLAMAAAQFSLYRSNDPRCNAHMQSLWKAAWASAKGAAWIAERSGHGAISEQAFLAGLLHDAGKLVILRAIEEISTAKLPGLALSDHLIEEMLDSLHCEYGYALMNHWHLPEIYCVVGRDHHLPQLDASNTLLVVVRLMDQVRTRLGIGCAPDTELLPAASEEAIILRLNEVQLADLEITLEDQLDLQAA
jgi:HD-like signal output (HDOD) protein